MASFSLLLGRDSQASATELWRTDLVSTKTEPVLSGIQMTEYDLSSDGKQVLFSTQPADRSSQLWWPRWMGVHPLR